MALAIDGVFDHRRMSVERVLAEVKSWGVFPEHRASAVIAETLRAVDDALVAVAQPQGTSRGMIEHLHWNVNRLLNGFEISEPKH